MPTSTIQGCGPGRTKHARNDLSNCTESPAAKHCSISARNSGGKHRPGSTFSTRNRTNSGPSNRDSSNKKDATSPTNLTELASSERNWGPKRQPIAAGTTFSVTNGVTPNDGSSIVPFVNAIIMLRHIFLIRGSSTSFIPDEVKDNILIWSSP